MASRYRRVNIDGKSLFKTETRLTAAALLPGTFAVINGDNEFEQAASGTLGRVYVIDCAYHQGLGIRDAVPAGNSAVGNYVEEGRELAILVPAGTYTKDQPITVGANGMGAAGAALAWNWNGASRYNDGYEQALADAQAAQAAIELGMQYERDKADADHRGAVLARQAADRVVADQRKRIDGLLYRLRSRPTTATAEPGTDGAGEDWIGIFAACVAEYDDMGREAGRLADKVGGLQGYVLSIRGKKQ